MNNITTRMAIEVASHEAIVRQAYKDGGGVWTWSIGITNASGHKVERYIDNPQPLSKCLDVYIWALKKYNDDVTKAFGDYDLNEHERAAALSFHWNTGAIRRASWVKSVKRGDMKKARSQFMMYRKPKSIIERRKKERDLFFDGKWSSDGKITEYTRVTRSHTPDWSSGVKIDITDALNDILNPPRKVRPWSIWSWFK